MVLLRINRSGSAPTFGVLIKDDGIPFALTLERPWLENRRRLSCIPPGAYTCRRVESPKFGNTFEITGVQDRSEILFHRGNLMADTHGCVLVGEQFGYNVNDRSEPEVVASRQGFLEFMTLNNGRDEFPLEIAYALQSMAAFSKGVTT